MSEKTIKRLYIGCIVILAAVAELAFYQMSGCDLTSMPSSSMHIAVDVLCLLICVILLFSAGASKPRDRQNRSFFRLIFVLGILSYSELFICLTELDRASVIDRLQLAYTLNYLLNILIQYCYWSYIREGLKLEDKKFKIFNIFYKIAAIVSGIAILLNWIYGYFFYVYYDGSHYYFVSGKSLQYFGLACILVTLSMHLLILLDRSINLHKKLTLATFQLFPILMIINTVVASQFSSHFIYDAVITGRYTHSYANNNVNVAYLLSILIIYINIFSQRSKKLLEKEMLLEKQNMTLMISQIQPHFLYNVLTTISNLCITDPEEAEETTVLFSQYLRTNLDSLRNTEAIPFRKEMDHIKTYVELEKKRFGDKLYVEYNIEADDFKVPALGLQPIVENSVKHGIREKDTKGHLKISSNKKDAGFEVVIEDDGVGFDTNAAPPDDGRSHVGMINVRHRLEQMCNASMTVESSPGNGCRTTIFFPK